MGYYSCEPSAPVTESPEAWEQRAQSWLQEPAAQYKAEYQASKGSANELPELNFFYEIEEVSQTQLSLPRHLFTSLIYYIQIPVYILLFTTGSNQG